MKVSDITEEALAYRLKSGAIFETGPFLVRITTRLRGLTALLHHLYADYPLRTDATLADLHVRVEPGKRLRRWIQPQTRFLLDGRQPFQPFPKALSLPILEWGINWSIAMRSHQYLILHAAVVERYGHALVMPALPGDGKSTLCAGLIHRGWRLFSDEFGLVRPEDNALVPIPRLLPLKNESIEVIRRFAPEATMGPSFPETHKGTVAHLRPPRASIERANETAKAACIVFPRWQAGARLQFQPLPPPTAFLSLASNAFNYETMGAAGFRTVGAMVRGSSCYRLIYSDLEEASAALDHLMATTLDQ